MSPGPIAGAPVHPSQVSQWMGQAPAIALGAQNFYAALIQLRCLGPITVVAAQGSGIQAIADAPAIANLCPKLRSFVQQRRGLWVGNHHAQECQGCCHAWPVAQLAINVITLFELGLPYGMGLIGPNPAIQPGYA